MGIFFSWTFVPYRICFLSWLFILRRLKSTSLFSKIIYLFMLAVLGLCHCSGFSLVAESRLLAAEHGLQVQASVAALGLRGRGCWPLEHRSIVGMHKLSCSWHVGSSPIRDGTLVSCTGRQVLDHWATREAPKSTFLEDNQPVGILKQWSKRKSVGGEERRCSKTKLQN